MNKQECEQLIEGYISWLRKGLSVSSIEDGCELTTPFLDRHNDHLQVYATLNNGKIMLTDDGYILDDLGMSGLNIQGSPKREILLNTMLNGFGVRKNDNQLVIEASKHNLGQRLHSLIQAMLAVNDMFVMAKPHVESLFLEDVQNYLSENNVRYSPQIKLAGKSSFDHTIHFLIPKSNNAPERMVQAINKPNKNNLTAYLFALNDIRQARGADSKAYTLLNDQEQEIRGDIFEALEAYDVKHALWSERAGIIEELAA